MPVHGADINQSQVPGREMESFYACQSRSLPYFLKVHAQIEPQNNFLVNPNGFCCQLARTASSRNQSNWWFVFKRQSPCFRLVGWIHLHHFDSIIKYLLGSFHKLFCTSQNHFWPLPSLCCLFTMYNLTFWFPLLTKTRYGELIYTCKMIQHGIFTRFSQPVHFCNL